MNNQLKLSILKRMRVDGSIYVSGNDTYTGNNVGMSNRAIRQDIARKRARLAKQGAAR